MEFLDLIQNGMHTAIVNYVRTCKCLSVDEEIALIKRGNHEEIMNFPWNPIRYTCDKGVFMLNYVS